MWLIEKLFTNCNIYKISLEIHRNRFHYDQWGYVDETTFVGQSIVFTYQISTFYLYM